MGCVSERSHSNAQLAESFPQNLNGVVAASALLLRPDSQWSGIWNAGKLCTLGKRDALGLQASITNLAVEIMCLKQNDIKTRLLVRERGLIKQQPAHLQKQCQTDIPFFRQN